MLVSGRVNHLLSYFTKHLKLPKGVIGTGTRLSIFLGGLIFDYRNVWNNSFNENKNDFGEWGGCIPRLLITI